MKRVNPPTVVLPIEVNRDDVEVDWNSYGELHVYDLKGQLMVSVTRHGREGVLMRSEPLPIELRLEHVEVQKCSWGEVNVYDLRGQLVIRIYADASHRPTKRSIKRGAYKKRKGQVAE